MVEPRVRIQPWGITWPPPEFSILEKGETLEGAAKKEGIQEERLILLEWVDSKGVTAIWESVDDLEPLLPSVCCSVGFLIEETEGYITIAQAVSDGQVQGRTTIPKCSIQKVVMIKRDKGNGN